MEIKIDKSIDCCVLEMIGQFWEQKDFQLFDNTVRQCIDDGQLVLAADFTRISFVSSQALGCLVRTYSKMNKLGGHFVLVNPSVSVRETLEIAGFLQFMKIFANKEKLQAFAAENKL